METVVDNNFVIQEEGVDLFIKNVLKGRMTVKCEVS